MISLEEIKTNPVGYYKYVRLTNNTFRFGDALLNHSELVPKGMQAISAGQIGVKNNQFAFAGYGSITLKLKWMESDEEELKKYLQMECIGRYEI